MKLKNWFLIAVAGGMVAGASIVNPAQAAQPSASQRPLRARWLERAKEKLGLSDEQVQQIKAQLAGQKETLKDLISDLHQARVNLRQAIQATGATESSVRAASAKVASVEADLAVERLKLYGLISPILTSDQLEKLNQVRDKIDEAIERGIDRLGDRLGTE